MKKKVSKEVRLHDNQIKCPSCSEIFEPSLWSDTGNYSENCPECGTEIGFHITIEIDGVHVID